MEGGERGGRGTLGGHLAEGRGRGEKKAQREGVTHTEGGEWEGGEEVAALGDTRRAAEVLRLGCA